MNERTQGPRGPRRDDRSPGGERGGRGERGGGKGRDGKGRGRGGPGGKGRDDRGGSAAFRVVNELGALEKALTKVDFAGQKGPLDEILRALRPLRLKSISDLDMNTRGRLITTLFRVARQAKPAGPAGDAPVAAAVADAPAADAPAVDASAGDPPAADAAAADAPAVDAPAGDASAGDAPAADAPAEAPAVEAAPGEAAPGEAAAEPAPADAPAGNAAKPGANPLTLWQDVMFAVGCIWQAAGDPERATAAFTASGREAPAFVPHTPAPRVEEGATPADGKRGGKRERGERAEKSERGAPDWKQQAQNHEDRGRTREAARLHEANQSWADAARLFEAGGEPRAALRNAIAGNLGPLAQKLMGLIRADDVPGILQKAGAWELLMEWHAKKGDFDGVARLYERAKQFDQAALAWERGGKLSNARRAYEKANDSAGALRVRDLEIQKLVERGDRLGAATVMVHAGMRAEAVKALEAVGGPKAWRFMLKLKLDAEAEAYIASELKKAEETNDLASKARWLEAKGEVRQAAQVWLDAGKKERAVPLFDQLGETARAAQLAEEVGQLEKAEALYRRAKDTANADRVKALPRPASQPPTEAPKAAESSAQSP
jgi:tetratricopeptide (TPR) repeat protein